SSRSGYRACSSVSKKPKFIIREQRLLPTRTMRAPCSSARGGALPGDGGDAHRRPSNTSSKDAGLIDLLKPDARNTTRPRCVLYRRCNLRVMIEPVVRILKLDEQRSDAEWWRSRPAEERLRTLESIRQEYHGWQTYEA